jgi:XTP/dITP diphosphohydrolase
MELKQLLDMPGAILVTPDEAGVEGEPVEDADSFRGNAEIKARYYASRSGLPTLADDSGLEVDALDGRPGVFTRRYAGPDASDAENNAKLLGELRGLPVDRRGARYQCVLAFLDPTDRAAGPNAGDASQGMPPALALEAVVPVFREGTFGGRIATHARGAGGFGYDPIFEPDSEVPGGRTVAQMSAGEKNGLSHRGKAARAMADYLRATGW